MGGGTTESAIINFAIMSVEIERKTEVRNLKISKIKV